MLILTRKINESIIINDNIEISIVDVRGENVKIGIDAPKQVKVFRKEVYQAIQEENEKAAASPVQIIPSLDDIIKKDKN